MNKFIVRLVIALVIVFGGGWFMGGVLNTAALLSPALVSQMKCSAGATAKQDYVQQSFDQPGQKTLTFSCVNADGSSVPLLTDAQTQANENRVFYPAGVIVMALIVAAWYVRSALQRGGVVKASAAGG